MGGGIRVNFSATPYHSFSQSIIPLWELGTLIHQRQKLWRREAHISQVNHWEG